MEVEKNETLLAHSFLFTAMVLFSHERNGADEYLTVGQLEDNKLRRPRRGQKFQEKFYRPFLNGNDRTRTTAKNTRF